MPAWNRPDWNRRLELSTVTLPQFRFAACLERARLEPSTGTVDCDLPSRSSARRLPGTVRLEPSTGTVDCYPPQFRFAACREPSDWNRRLELSTVYPPAVQLRRLPGTGPTGTVDWNCRLLPSRSSASPPAWNGPDWNRRLELSTGTVDCSTSRSSASPPAGGLTPMRAARGPPGGIPMRMHKLLLTGFVVLAAGLVGAAAPQEVRKAPGSTIERASVPAGKKICGYPRPEGVPVEVWENACEACTSVPVSPETSADGTLTSHSCDGGYEVRIKVVPGKSYPAGAKREIMKGGGLGEEKPPNARSARSARCRRWRRPSRATTRRTRS